MDSIKEISKDIAIVLSLTGMMTASVVLFWLISNG
jgi:hypothetical protein